MELQTPQTMNNHTPNKNQTLTKPVLGMTTDYRIFKRLKGNRKIDTYHVDSLAVSFSQKSLIPQIPLIVNEKMEVIDGQHRLALAQRLGLPVSYIVIAGTNHQDVMRLNKYVRPWKLTDYLESYIELGKEDYMGIKRFVQKYGMSISLAIYLLDLGSGSDFNWHKKGQLSRFKDGSFEITSKPLAEKIAQQVLNLIPYLQEGVHKDREFIEALVVMDGTVSPTEFISQLVKSQNKLLRQTTMRQYLREVEKIMGLGTKKALRLF